MCLYIDRTNNIDKKGQNKETTVLMRASLVSRDQNW